MLHHILPQMSDSFLLLPAFLPPNPQLKPAGSVCREKAGECDLSEFCTGASSDCPEDAFQMDGKPCFDQGEGFCHSGRCPTHQQHCWRLFGKGTAHLTTVDLPESTSVFFSSGATVGPPECFGLNRRGEEGANCGRNKSGYVPCAAAYVHSLTRSLSRRLSQNHTWRSE